ncbi:MAG: hypothetical protein LCH53_13900 [Bacteroidetes bacterium]|nr:hypothetical protein [Bacteroidota bacterium]
MRCFVFLLALLLPLAASAQPLGDAPVGRLYAGWTVRSADGRVGPLPMAVPGTIHPSLVRAGTISDPLVGANEQAAAWQKEPERFHQDLTHFTPRPYTLDSGHGLLKWAWYRLGKI